MTDDGVREPEHGVYVAPTEQPCGTCGAPINSATEATPSRGRPTAGDASLCFYCGALEVFTGDGLTRRALTPEETVEYGQDYAVAAAQAWIRRLSRGR